MVSPAPGNNCNADRGIPARCANSTAKAAIKGVCSAGFANTGFPAARLAAICPTKIANGKFHGLMHTTGPIGAESSVRSARAVAA